MRQVLIALVLAMTVACGSSATSPATVTYTPNTDLKLPLPDGSLADVADPHVIKVDSTWYLYGTHSMVNLEAWSSTDLNQWRYEGVIWEPTKGSWNDHGNIWAPHVEHAPDAFYLYYVGNGRTGVAKAASPSGPFVEVYDHPLVGAGYGGIGDGVYLSPHYDVLNPLSVIAALPMKDYVTLADVPTRVVLDADPDTEWESVNREGPAVIEQDGVIHLIYSGNLWWTPDYALGAASATSPTGPFTRQVHNPFLSHASASGLWGPGHCSVAPGAHGDRLVFFHAKVDAAQYSARRTRYAPIAVNAAGEVTVTLTP
jgi:beta-xylosidase